MLRPAALVRAFAAPSRRLLQQLPAFTVPLASRRSLATTASSTTTTTTPPPPPQQQPASASSPSSSSPQTAKTAPEPQPAPPQPATPSAAAAGATGRAALPFHISRTPSNRLAIYHRSKRGGNLKQTVIKKVEGDRAAFRELLTQALTSAEEGAEKEEEEQGPGGKDTATDTTEAKDKGKKAKAKELVKLNPVTGHVVVSGHRRVWVKNFIEKLGF
ncbi:uncharacterized protein THITE_2117961 [Thermothielavioides terrestris NRRL 8126]|uniref:Large ribosomal subunit protein mL49 n=1 Tax=Thermothielavioides terrestris (strain ATCC 38088 / NRRL 8126) TaxID=578455 RepID=G2R695_THETT|nr:uncharacterized protein THITE_2117961 [Thermothielavioides terrestris NRRL 8126]AEO68428.1 hypothetical protein THITE_2117961 [Thermothielavioides terrestris NRRL 8126]